MRDTRDRSTFSYTDLRLISGLVGALGLAVALFTGFTASISISISISCRCRCSCSFRSSGSRVTARIVVGTLKLTAADTARILSSRAINSLQLRRQILALVRRPVEVACIALVIDIAALVLPDFAVLAARWRRRLVAHVCLVPAVLGGLPCIISTYTSI